MNQMVKDPSTIKLSEPVYEMIEQVRLGAEDINKQRPFTEKVEERILNQLLPSRIVESLNTEGIMVTKRQTLDVMHALQMHEAIGKGELEIKNMLEADEFVFEACTLGTCLTSSFIRELGGRVTNGLIAESKNFRQGSVTISGAAFQPPPPEDVLPLINQLCTYYETNRELSPLVLAAWLHASLARIHPFSDGNGRTARLLQNWSMICHGYFPMGMPISKRDDYYDALENADYDNWDDLVEMICLLELDIISKIKAIIRDEKTHSKWIEKLSEKANESKKNTLYKSYASWRAAVDYVSKSFINTAIDLNEIDAPIYVKYREYDISGFSEWKTMKEKGWMDKSWLFSMQFVFDGRPFYRAIAFFRRHDRRSWDPVNLDDSISLFFTGAECRSDGAEEKINFSNYSDRCIALREIAIQDGNYYVFKENIQAGTDESQIICEECDSINQVIEGFFTDVFVKKAGL